MEKAAVLAFFLVLPLLPQRVSGQMVVESPSLAEQCPPPPAVVAAFLAFSPGQAEEFGILLNQSQNNLRSLQEQIAPRQQQLDALLSQPNPDPAMVGALVLQIHALQYQQAQVIRNFRSAFASLLTQEQKQKIEQATVASQLQPAVGAFVALRLVPPPPSLPCQKP
jgi:septal ring factor EnvC (AmiA/AmiB activator)